VGADPTAVKRKVSPQMPINSFLIILLWMVVKRGLQFTARINHNRIILLFSVVSSRLSVRLQGLLLRTLGPVPLERLTHDNAELYLCQPGRHNNVVNISRGPFWSVCRC
jgi:hypothetical protein